jgi:hypothetical protein
MSNKVYEAALGYLMEGFSVIPLKQRSKDPLPGFEWKKYQTERAGEEDIKLWFENHPERNIGIITGSISGVDVWDIDAIKELEFLDEPIDTAQVRTGSGLPHVYYQHTKGISRITRKNIKGVEISSFRGDGSYVVAPPSIHPNGEPYEWVEGYDILTVGFATIPQGFLEKLKVPAFTKGTTMPIIEVSLPNPTEIFSGNRHDFLFKKGSSLRARGLPVEEIRVIIEDINKKKCKPNPVPSHEIDNIMHSIASYPEGQEDNENTEHYLELPPIPSYPLENLPPKVVKAIRDISKGIWCPVEMVAAGFFADISTAIGAKTRLRVKRRYFEYGNLWLLLVAPSGSKKSPGLRSGAHGMMTEPGLMRITQTKSPNIKENYTSTN